MSNTAELKPRLLLVGEKKLYQTAKKSTRDKLLTLHCLSFDGDIHVDELWQ